MVGGRFGAGCTVWAEAIAAYANDANDKPVVRIRRVTCHLVADDIRATVVPPAATGIDAATWPRRPASRGW